MASTVAVIACGALAREILAILAMNGLTHVTLKCLPASLHNHPSRIPDAVARAIDGLSATHDEIFVAYGDCGTGGLLDRVLETRGVTRIAGPHCYSFFSGNDEFEGRGDADMRCFYLTDFLVRQFETLVVRPLWLDRRPELLPDYFGSYETLVYLAQTQDEKLDAKARNAAAFLGLEYEKRQVGYADLASFLTALGGVPVSSPRAAAAATRNQVGNCTASAAGAPLQNQRRAHSEGVKPFRDKSCHPAQDLPPDH